VNAEAYARQLKQLLPPGRLWKLEPDSWLSKVLLAIGDELARIDARGEKLIDEADPRTALETLPEWERMLGITPPAGATAGERQLAITAAYVSRGGQTAAYYIALAASLGYVATVTDTGLGAHTWRLNVDLSQSTGAPTFTEFRADESRAEDRVESRDVAVLEAAIERAKPAHTVCLFLYTS
jgi:uncharacterized protein YmfQ (DUF2313 family)